MDVQATFTSQSMSNRTTKMAQVYIQINGNLHFFSNLDNVDDLENVLLQIKIFDVNIFDVCRVLTGYPTI